MHISTYLGVLAIFGATSAQVVSQISDGQLQAPPVGAPTTFLISTVTMTTTATSTPTSDPSPSNHWEVAYNNVSIYRSGGHVTLPARISSCTGMPCFSWSEYTSQHHSLLISGDMGGPCRYHWAGTNRGGVCGGMADHMDMYDDDAISQGDVRNIKHVCFEGDGPKEGQVFIMDWDLLWDGSSMPWENAERFARLMKHCREKFIHGSPLERDGSEGTDSDYSITLAR